MTRKFWNKIRNSYAGKKLAIFDTPVEWQDALKNQSTNRSLTLLSWQAVIYESQHGRSPKEWEIDKIREVIEQSSYLKISGDSKEATLGLDKSFSISCERIFAGQNVLKKEFQENVTALTQSACIQSERLRALEKGTFEQHKALTFPESEIRL